MSWAPGCEIFGLRADTQAMRAALQSLAPHADDRPLRFRDAALDFRSGIAVYGAARQLADVFSQYPSAEQISHRIIQILADQVLNAVLLGLENNQSDQIRRHARADRAVSVSTAIELIDAETCATHSVTDLARHCGVTVRGVELGFRKSLGVTPHAFLQRTRLEKAHGELRVADAGAVPERAHEVAVTAIGEDGATTRTTWAQLRAQVAAFAGWLREAGVRSGDRVVGYLPNAAPALVAFLATASIGAVWSACGQDYCRQGAAARFAQLEPVLLVAADGTGGTAGPWTAGARWQLCSRRCPRCAPPSTRRHRICPRNDVVVIPLSNPMMEGIKMPARSSVIDFHAHFVPDFYRDAAAGAGYGNPTVSRLPHWSVDEALSMMDRDGITVAVASVSSPGVHFGGDAAARHLARIVNEFNAGVVAKYPDRFAVLASLPLPDIDGALAELTYAYDVLHANGVVWKPTPADCTSGTRRWSQSWTPLTSGKR